MAKNSARKSEPRHTQAGPDIAPRGREMMMEEHRGRREDEPAAAAMETDAESGGASSVADLPEGEAPPDPAKQYEERQLSSDSPAPTGSGWLMWVIGLLLVLAVAYAVVLA